MKDIFVKEIRNLNAKLFYDEFEASRDAYFKTRDRGLK
jgi:hypothetical protein